ncbi:MAG: hypothetical protein AVDCRST_MAG12-485, partial [uncultured Rubrobacteraceae bacterium]
VRSACARRRVRSRAVVLRAGALARAGARVAERRRDLRAQNPRPGGRQR